MLTNLEHFNNVAVICLQVPDCPALQVQRNCLSQPLCLLFQFPINFMWMSL